MFIVAYNRNYDGRCHQGRVISRHRKLTRAVAAYDAIQARCKRDNGENTWRDIGIFDGNGDAVAAEDIYNARDLNRRGWR